VVQETLRTLRFTMSAARIRNRPVRFLDPQEKLILELKEEIKRLRIENQQLRQVNLGSRSEDRASVREQEVHSQSSKRETSDLTLPTIRSSSAAAISVRYRDDSDDDPRMKAPSPLPSEINMTTSPLQRAHVRSSFLS
jgi:hypothetical protein